MALFKIKKGQKANLPTTYNEGYCYLTTDDGKFYIDTSNAASGRIVLNAGKADQLSTSRTISLTGDVTGSATFNGSANANIITTIADNSHNHSASEITSGTLAAARLPAATTSAQGAMTAAMVTKLNGIATGANKITVDTALSSTSTNPVQNKVVSTEIDNLKSKAIQIHSRSDIGTSPNYDDPGVNGLFEMRASSEVTGETGIKPFDGFGPFLSLKTSDNVAMMQLAGSVSGDFYIRCNQKASVDMANMPWKKVATIEDTNISRIAFVAPAANWVQASTGRYTQTIAVANITSQTQCNLIDIDMSNVTESNIADIKQAWGFVDNAEYDDTGVKLTCFTDAPTTDIPLIIDIQGTI